MALIFVYGTLQEPDVQRRVFGRVTKGTPDKLKGFRKANFEQYPMAVPDEAGQIEGRVLEVTDEEIARMDFYEGDAYIRVSVTLESGREAWVYRNNPDFVSLR